MTLTRWATLKSREDSVEEVRAMAMKFACVKKSEAQLQGLVPDCDSRTEALPT
jgi:hypothetical protein